MSVLRALPLQAGCYRCEEEAALKHHHNQSACFSALANSDATHGDLDVRALIRLDLRPTTKQGALHLDVFGSDDVPQWLDGVALQHHPVHPSCKQLE